MRVLPRSSPQGDLGAFIGDAGDGPGVFVAEIRPGGGIFLVAGGALDDGFQGFTDRDRVAVTSTNGDRVRVVFAAMRDGVAGVFAQTGRFVGDDLVVAAEPVRALAVGDAVAGSTVSSFSLCDPLNANGRLAVWTTMSDGAVAVLRLTPQSRIVSIVPNEVRNRRCDSYFSIPLAGQPANVTARELVVEFVGAEDPTESQVDAVIVGARVPVCSPGWDDAPQCTAEVPPAPVVDGAGRAVLPTTVTEPGAVGLSEPLGHELVHDVGLVVDGMDAVRRSEPVVALWRVPALIEGVIQRYSMSDLGGDEWAAKGTIDWLEDMAPKLAAAGVPFAVNDISGEHGINIGHCDHAFGTDLDIYHFEHLRGCDQPLGGLANYNELVRLVRLAFQGEAAARERVASFFAANRVGLEILLTESEPPGAVARVLGIRGEELTTAVGPLARGWAEDAMRTGVIAPVGNPAAALDLGIGEWQGNFTTGYRGAAGHNDHYHVDLDERAIGASVPPGCGAIRAACVPSAVALVAREAPACR